MVKVVGIYQIKAPDGKMYIGASRNIYQRFNHHKNICTTKHRKLRESLDKFGRNNHEYLILHKLPSDVSDDVIDRYEVFYIEQFKSCGIGLLNLTSGGRVNFKFTQDSIDSMKGKQGKHMKGRRLSDESIEKIRAKLKGIKRSEETKRKLSEGKMGAKNPMFGKHTNNKS